MGQFFVIEIISVKLIEKIVNKMLQSQKVLTRVWVMQSSVV